MGAFQPLRDARTGKASEDLHLRLSESNPVEPSARARVPAQCARPGAGKRGGVRVIYYWLSADWQIRLLMLYPKSRKDDLSAAEKAMLKNVVEKWNG